MRSFARRCVLLLSVVGCAHRGSTSLVSEAPQAVTEMDPVAQASLLLAAESLDVSLRMRALEVLVAHAPSAEGHALAQRALYDPSPYVKRKAVALLGSRLPEADALELLGELAGRSDVDAYTRGQAGVQLALAGEHGTASTLSQAWRQADQSWDVAPLALGAAMMGDDEALPALDGALREGAFPLEVDFFVALGRSELPSLVDALTEAATLVEEELVLPIGIAHLGLGSSVGARIFKEALGDPSEERRLEVLDYLADMEGEFVLPLLRRARAMDLQMVHAYAELIMVGRGELPLSLAVEAAGAADRELRCMALDAMARALASTEAGRRAEREARGILMASLGDPEPVVRLAAARALARCGLPEEQAQLQARLAALQDDDEQLPLRVELSAALLAVGQRG